MATTILFEEIQGSDNKNVRRFFKVTALLFAAGIGFNLLKQKAVITTITVGLFTGLVLCILVAVFATIKLVTQIRTDGIYVRFPPLRPSFICYTWSSIKDVYIRNYDALSEYGGWGFRFGPSGQGYIVSGTVGIQLEFFDGANVLITTKQPETVAAILKERNKY